MTPTGLERRSARSMDGRAFSLIELVIVVAIIGVVALIAIPRFSAAASNASDAAMLQQTAQFQSAIDHYKAEHQELSPAHDSSGQVRQDAVMFAKHLTFNTTIDGETDGPFGPYLRDIPLNLFNRSDTVEIDDGIPGDNSSGWFYDSRMGWIMPDDPRGFQLFREHLAGNVVLGKVDESKDSQVVSGYSAASLDAVAKPSAPAPSK